MGLDVYLYRYEDKDAVRSLEHKFEEEVSGLWKQICGEGYSDLDKTEQELRYGKYKKEKEKIALSMGLNANGEDERKRIIEIDSSKYSDHMFKIGYFRSSYNGGGINTILRNYIGKDLYTIFGLADNNDYVVKIDWAASLARCQEIRKEFSEKIGTDGSYGILQVSFNPFKGPSKKINDEKQALEKFLEIKNTHIERDEDWKSFSNLDGEFYLGKQPLRVAGIIHGISKYSDIPCEYVIFHRDKTEEDEGYNWYVQALEIVEETCQWVLDTKEPEKFFLHWSA